MTSNMSSGVELLCNQTVCDSIKPFRMTMVKNEIFVSNKPAMVSTFEGMQG